MIQVSTSNSRIPVVLCRSRWFIGKPGRSIKTSKIAYETRIHPIDFVEKDISIV